MPAPAFQRVEELFHEAVALDPADRPAFLDAACAGDAELRAAVEDLLRHDLGEKATDSFLVSPVAGAAERLRPEAPTRPDVGPAETVSPAAPLPCVPGYEVLGERGRGGMGVVYKARQVGLNRLVALKMLLPNGSSVPELLARFRAEAEALARLHHPNIVPVYDIGECEGRPYFTMEYVDGPNLAQMLNGRPQDSAAAARLLEVLARTMHAVHQAGLIHRDLKPANVLLAACGLASGAKPQAADCVPKITDFGLAKDQTAGRKLTRTGVAMGTPCYMAPEQARHWESAVGPAADIYALGAILYEMLTGRPPFDAETPAETIVQLLNEEPLSPARLRPGLPRDLVTICLKCLEKSPRRRYASAWDLAEDLRRFQAGEPIRARPIGPAERCYRWCRRRPVVAALLALSGLLAVALVITVVVYDARLERALAATEQRAADEQRQIVQLNIRAGVTALEDEDTFTAVFYFTEALRQDQGSDERNHRTRIATTLRQSPELLRWRTLEHPPLLAPPFGAALSPDGRFLAAIGGDGTGQVADLTTGTSRALVLGQGEAVRRLAFLPDGRLLLTERANGTVRSWDLSGQKPQPLQQLSAGESALSALSDNGRWLLTLDAAGRAEVRDVLTGKATAAPLPLGEGTKPAAVSEDGRHVAAVGSDNALTVWDVPAARSLGKPVLLPRDVSLVVLSPDAERVLTAGSNRAAQVWQVRTGELRAAWSRLAGAVTHARFSPDGRLVLLGDAGGNAKVWGAVTAQAVTPPLGRRRRLVLATFFHDGEQAVTADTTGTVSFWRLPRGPEVSDAAALGGEGAAADGGGRVIRLANGLTVSARPVTAGVLRPPGADGTVEHAAFSPDGRRVVVCEEDTTVRVWDTATGALLTPALRHGGAVLYGAFSPDGRRLLTASDDRAARVWDAVTGEVLAPPLRHGRAITRVFFQAGGDRACVVQEGGVVSTWDLAPDERPLDELRALAQELAPDRAGR